MGPGGEGEERSTKRGSGRWCRGGPVSPDRAASDPAHRPRVCSVCRGVTEISLGTELGRGQGGDGGCGSGGAEGACCASPAPGSP